MAWIWCTPSLKMPAKGAVTAAKKGSATATVAVARKVVGKRKYVVQETDIKDVMEISRQQLGDWKQWRKVVELSNLEPPFRVRSGDVLWLPLYE